MKQAYIEQKQGTSYNDNFQEVLDFIAVPLKNKSQQILDAEFSIKKKKRQLLPFQKRQKKMMRKFKERRQDTIPPAGPQSSHDEFKLLPQTKMNGKISALSVFDQVMNILIKEKLPHELVEIFFEYLPITYLESIGATLDQLLSYSKKETFHSLKRKLRGVNVIMFISSNE